VEDGAAALDSAWALEDAAFEDSAGGVEEVPFALVFL